MPEQTDPPMVTVRLANTTQNEKWDLDAPANLPAHELCDELVAATGSPQNERDGRRIPYRLRWEEGDRYLSEGETLEDAGVQEGDQLTLAYEARAGGTGVVGPDAICV